MLQRVLIANRGEISVRIARAADALGLESVAVYASDDAASGHVPAASVAVALPGVGPRAYLDSAALIAAAHASGCDAIHPGYGFLSENADFAAACQAAVLTFIGPAPETLRALGDKAAARALAERLNVPQLAGTQHATSLTDAKAFFASLTAGAAMMIKACAGGGGRGIRAVTLAHDIDVAFERCQSEARAAFGNGDVYVEEMLLAARHIEVQIIGDGRGGVVALGERECTLQRRHQKLIEMAPSPSLDPDVRRQLLDAAQTMARALDYRGLGTFEFLVATDAVARSSAGSVFVFMEANARLQVEHTVTEMAYGCDLVAAQLRIAGGATLQSLGLDALARLPPARMALQVRVNAETMTADAGAVASAGTITQVQWPGGPGVRVDTHAYAGYRMNPAYDSLLAKIIVDGPLGEPAAVMRKAARALREAEVGGLATNIAFLRALLADADVQADRITTRFIDQNAARLLLASAPFAALPDRQAVSPGPIPRGWSITDSTLTAPLPGSVVEVRVVPGAAINRGDTLAVIEAMKMEHLVEARSGGIIRAVHIARGDVLATGQPMFEIDADAAAHADQTQTAAVDLDLIRPDLQAVIDAHRYTLDANRPQAIAKRHKIGMRSARENLDDLLDPGSFIEYGALAVAAQRARRSLDDLKANTPADGLITGIGTVNAAHTEAEAARVAVMAYDYTVLAGTQGKLNHKKSDRLLDVAARWAIPMVLFAEGGGGRPGDTDAAAVSGLDCTTFHHFAALSGRVPVVGIVAGRCFAGNAALLGCSDVIIATATASIGMGGPAMIEGGGLGVVAPDAVGPVSVQAPNGVIDILVKDEAEAVAAAKQYLGYFQGSRPAGPSVDQRALRHVIPENRLRVYDIRAVVDTLADTGSVLELRAAFGVGAITALIRIDGRPFGLIANNPKHLGGAIDAPACDKLARFLQLCDAFSLPVVSLCDTPGFMVGVDSETTAMVRKTSRLFVAGAALRVPVFTIVLRKGYGLGAMAMAAGWFHAPMFTVAWPTGEFGPMGLEGAVRLGYRKELAAAPTADREGLFTDMVAASYARGKGTNAASYLEIDAVIDPAETRRWILRGLATAPRDLGPRRSFIDPW
jgi:acetyl/propionyl-CoA carboxylase alpha subunit/acetyl-CoA carboxylase carboxyltransferase component